MMYLDVDYLLKLKDAHNFESVQLPMVKFS